MKKNFTFLFVFSIFLFSACDYDLGSGTIVEVNKDFEFRLLEKLDTEGGTYYLDVESVSVQGCSNAVIDHSLAQSTDRFIVTIKSINKPDSCVGGRATAKKRIELGRIANGSPRLQINLRDAVINEGFLKINDDNVTLDMQTENGISIKDKLLQRMPRRAIWGLLGGDNAALVDAFLDSLNQKTTSAAQMVNGNYGHFFLNNSTVGNIELSSFDVTLKPSRTTFVRMLPVGREAAFARFVQNYRAQNATRIDLKIYAWDGTVY
ncbi:MAG: hypothetical protein RL757_1311 [Bacteroidota bacterium]|jgi:hypothetical protein